MLLPTPEVDQDNFEVLLNSISYGLISGICLRQLAFLYD